MIDVHQQTFTKHIMKIINWFQIPVSDLKRAVNFYSTVFKMSFHEMEHQGEKHAFFAMDAKDSQMTGGELVQSVNCKPGRDGVTIYLNPTDGLDAALMRLPASGGKIIMPKTSIGENGWIALVEDTEGNKIGIHSM